METGIETRILRAEFTITRPDSTAYVRYHAKERPMLEVEIENGSEGAFIETLNELEVFGPSGLGHAVRRNGIHLFYCDEWPRIQILRYEAMVKETYKIQRDMLELENSSSPEFEPAYKLEPGDRQFLKKLSIDPE